MYTALLGSGQIPGYPFLSGDSWVAIAQIVVMLLVFFAVFVLFLLTMFPGCKSPYNKIYSWVTLGIVELTMVAVALTWLLVSGAY